MGPCKQEPPIEASDRACLRHAISTSPLVICKSRGNCHTDSDYENLLRPSESWVCENARQIVMVDVVAVEDE